MVFVFGVDVPLVELLLAITIVTFIMLIEVTVVMLIMFYQMRRSKEITAQLRDLVTDFVVLKQSKMKAKQK